MMNVIKISILLLIFVLIVTAYRAMPILTSDKTPEGPTNEQIASFETRETADWTGEETSQKFAIGEIPPKLKVADRNLFLGIATGGNEGLEIKLKIINIGEDTIILNSIIAVINVEFTNNPGEFKEYEIEIFSEQISFRGFSTAQTIKHIKTNDELFDPEIKSFYITEIKVV